MIPVATVETFGEGRPGLLIEVPHGAEEQQHYDTVDALLKGVLPAHLERFFWVNTDVGSYALGRAIAAASPVPAVLVRCLVPRTFIDVNRLLTPEATGMTPGLQPYILNPADQALLRSLHQRYTEQVKALYDQVCPDGLAIIPHTYAPRSVPIDTVDAQIVPNLERVYQPEILETCPLRPELDVITRTPEGVDRSPPGVADKLIEGLIALGIAAERDGTYNLHPATMGRVWSDRWPGKVLCFEVRRDLVTEWNPFGPKPMRHSAIEGLAAEVQRALYG